MPITIPVQPVAAKQIVAIQNILALPMTVTRRSALVSKQATLWESFFPGCGFEQIEASIH